MKCERKLFGTDLDEWNANDFTRRAKEGEHGDSYDHHRAID